MKFKALFLIALFTSIFATGSTLQDAKDAYQKGKYRIALPMLQEQYTKNPKNASINQWIGVCLYNTGEIAESKKYFEFAASKSVIESDRYLALIDYHEYNFAKAKEMLDRYQSNIKKEKKALPEDLSILNKKINMAQSMFDHIEKIVIIDSMIVDKKTFFKTYKLSNSAGSLNAQKNANGKETIVYMPESQERKMWSMPDNTGTERLYESTKLSNGTWDKEIQLNDMLNDGGDAKYPYMMPDGTNLYYACNGNNTLGGYDIFIARKDTETGDYLQPQNIGMPYNSPYDDYMLVIDEETGIGWWATDRNQIPGKLTVYVFIPNAIRANYSPEDKNITSLAAIKRIKDTWIKKDYSELLKKINNINNTTVKESKDFVFTVSNGRVYTSFDDFKSAESRHRMAELIDLNNALAKDSQKLRDLRKEYVTSSASKKASLKNNIIQLENVVDKYYSDIYRMENAIRQLEQ